MCFDVICNAYQGLELGLRAVNPSGIALRAVANPNCSERVLRAVKSNPCVTGNFRNCFFSLK